MSNNDLFISISNRLTESANTFLIEKDEISGNISEDFSTIIDDHDISAWKSNIDGEVKGVDDLISELDIALKTKDRQKCIESIAMLRCAIADAASAFSNAMDSMEELVVSIRDK